MKIEDRLYQNQLILVELLLKFSAVKSLLLQKGLVTEAEIDEEIQVVSEKVLAAFDRQSPETTSEEPEALPEVKPSKKLLN